VVRCALDSLALKYRWVVERLEEAHGRTLGPIHIIGGGTQNRLLCQITANATGKQVITGPIEATAMGNILIQAMGLGYLKNLDEVREVVRNSTTLETYDPQPDSKQEDAYAMFLKVMK
jgi:sugar (pentulose or hexulose) kinase